MDNETEVILEQMEGTRASLAEKLETLENQVVGTIQEATSTVSATVQQVTEAVTGTVESVKETVEGTVETVKDTVEGTVESVKDTLDVRKQVRHHPWLMFGGAFAVGFMAGRLMRRYGPSPGEYMPSWQGVTSAVRGFSDHFASAPQQSSYAGASQGGGGYAYGGAAEPSRQESSPRPESQAERHGILDTLTSALGPEVSKLKGLAIGAGLGLLRDMVARSAPPELGSQLAEMVNGVTTRLGGEVLHGPILDSFTGGHSSSQQGHGERREETMAGSAHHPH